MNPSPTTTYVCLLRGVNVSGQKPIKMDELRALCQALGLRGARTYLQSGNLVFEAPDLERDAIGPAVERGIAERFGHAVAVLVLAAQELRQVVERGPFGQEPGADDARRLVTFLAQEPARWPLEALESKRQEGEALHCAGKAVYLHCPDGYGKTKLTNAFLEKRLGCAATTRNWKTTLELLRMAEA